MFIEINKQYSSLDTPLPLVVQTVGTSQNQGQTDRPQGFISHHCLWVLDGECLLTIEGEPYTLSKGQGFYCRPGIPHSYRSAGGTLKTAWFTFYGGEGVLDYYKAGDHFLFTASPHFNAAHSALLETCRKEGNIITRGAAGLQFLTDWLESVFSPSPAKTVRLYMEAHFSEPLTLDELAEKACMSRYALCHYYKEKRGVSVMEELKRIRMDKAKQMLLHTAAPIGEIARACGYENPGYFCKLFRELSGASPNQYRKDMTHHEDRNLR
ncbi:MAG: AraC family transcriptional regulator [Clostridia bacterium]|nr:AraC family transcriptional regulator [Clostridia bacterium]